MHTRSRILKEPIVRAGRPGGALVALCIVVGLSVTRADGTITFTSATPIGVSAGSNVGPQAIALADVNNDHMPDLLVVDSSNAVRVFLNSGGGSFRSVANLPVGAGPVAVTTGNFNRDNSPDIAVVNGTDDTVSVLLGDGQGGFANRRDFDVDPFSVGAVAADLDGDGLDDLAVLSDETVYLLKSNGDGTFTPFDIASVDTGTTGDFAIARGKFDSSGFVDLVISSLDSDSVIVLLGDGHGSFQAAEPLGVGLGPTGVVVADLNGDGKQDIAAVDSGALADLNVSLLHGNGDGSFQGAIQATALDSSVAIAAADFDRDGTTDLAVTSENSDNPRIAILCQPSAQCSPSGATFDGGFVLLNQSLGLGSGQQAIQAGDINGDGLPDLVALDTDGAVVGVFINTTATTPGPSPTPMTTATVTPSSSTPSTPTATPTVGSPTATETASPTPTPTSSVPTATGTPTRTPRPPTTPPAIPGFSRCEIPLNFQPSAIAAGDFNNDGTSDFAIVTSGGIVKAFLSNAGRFQAGECFDALSPGAADTTVIQGAHVITAPAANNRNAAVALVVGGDAGISVLSGDATRPGAFNVEQTLNDPANASVVAVAFADTNNDHIPDVVMGTSNGISVFLGKSAGGFATTPVNPHSVAGLASVVVQDFNGDALMDIAVVGQSGLSIFLQGKSAPVAPSLGAGTPAGMVGGDLDNDGIADLMILTRSPASIQVFLGPITSGSQRLNTDVTGGPLLMAAADFNGDGNLDAVVAMQDGTLSFFVGDGQGRLTQTSLSVACADRVTCGSPLGLVTAQLDNQARPDVVTVNPGNLAGSLSVLLSSNPTIAPSPTATPTVTPTTTATATNTGTPTQTPLPTAIVTVVPTNCIGQVCVQGESCAIADPVTDHQRGVWLLPAALLWIVRRRRCSR
jgi:hypothetical protein